MNSGIFARLCFLLACIGLSGQASAWIAVNPGAASVSTIVSGNAGRWDYSYSVTNMTTCATGQCETVTILGIPVSDQLRLVQFVVPYFTDYNLTNVVAPANWTWHIDTTDIFGFGIPTAQALVWEASNLMNGVEMGSTLGNFGFQAAYSAGYGPFQGQLGLGSVFFGDPPVPLSPEAVRAGLSLMPSSSVPEPSSFALLVLAVLGMATVSRAYGNK